MRGKKALANTISDLLLQLVTVICGFIVPRLMLTFFGSSVNGTVLSINQFLGYIIILETGVGAVIKATLYKPLAENDTVKLSGIIAASEKFFRKIAYIFIVYLFMLAILYPYLVRESFSRLYIFSLVLIIGISTFVQYYFSISYQILLQTDQRMYLTSMLQIATVIVNTILVVIMIKLGAGIHVVKLGSAVVFIIRPIVLKIYVERKYNLDKKVPQDNKAIQQRWDGLGQHIAYFIHTNTDMVVLTLFTDIKEVSVYSIYYMIVISISKLISSVSNGISAAFGDMMARDEKEILHKTFNLFEFINFILTTISYTSTALLIVPFVTVYTNGVSDVNYLRPSFAYILVAAEAIYCLRSPYTVIVYGAGHFKQTNRGAYIEAGLNIIISIILVIKFGIIGVAVGTLIAILFRTMELANYLSKCILYLNIRYFIKRCGIYCISVIVTIIIVRLLPAMPSMSYVVWIIYALEVFTIATIIVIITSIIFYKNDCIDLIKFIKRFVKR